MGKQILTRRTLTAVAAVLALVILAISPRSLLAPSHSFDRASESKRPKTPKNVVRADSHHVANSERPGKAPRPSPGQDTPQQFHDLQVRIALASPLLNGAFQELTKPDYLRILSSSPPLAPPV